MVISCGWLVPEVPMPHPEGQRSLTYCNSTRARGFQCLSAATRGSGATIALGYPKQSCAIGGHRSQLELIGINLISSDKSGIGCAVCSCTKQRCASVRGAVALSSGARRCGVSVALSSGTRQCGAFVLPVRSESIRANRN